MQANEGITINMPQVQKRKRKGEIYCKSFVNLLLGAQACRLFSAVFRFRVFSLVIFNLFTFGEAHEFCFDGSNEDHRLNSTVVQYVQARTGLECIMFCMREDKSCRSVNFRKTLNCDKNCEFLTDVHSEKPELLLKDDRFDYYVLLDSNRKPPEPVSPNSPSQTTQESPSNEEPLSSCKELLERNRSLSNGVYNLKHKYLLENYKVYCQMTNISGCGQGGWTLVMKVNGTKNEFKYDSPYWTNNQTYAVNDGLEGLTEKQTKLASYWNTPFKKICLGMKVNGETKWIVIDYQAESLFHVIAAGNFTKTTAGNTTWASLITGSSLQYNCNKEGFNLKCENDKVFAHVRIGIVANNQATCTTCDSYLGFGASLFSCNVHSTITCGNLAICSRSSHYDTDTYIPSFGYILVQ